MNYDKTKHKWQHEAIGFGIILYLLNIILFPSIYGVKITLKWLLIGIPISVIGGILYVLTVALIMKIFSGKKKQQPTTQ
jgi:hypothetical protein